MHSTLREIEQELGRLAASSEYRAEQKVLVGPKELKHARKLLVKARSLAENDVGALTRVVSDWASTDSNIWKLVSVLSHSATRPREG
jgi:hypothetical protein